MGRKNKQKRLNKAAERKEQKAAAAVAIAATENTASTVAPSISYEKNTVDGNTIQWDIHIRDFEKLQHKRGKSFMTDIIEAYGHLWKLMIYPRGNPRSDNDVEHVSIFLYFAGENAETDPVIITGYIRTELITRQLPTRHEFSKGVKNSRGWQDFSKREDIINCDNGGMFTITIEFEEAPTILSKDIISVDENTVKREIHICHFANLRLRRGDPLYTGTINAHGHLWKLQICPRGANNSNADVEHVSIFVMYDGENTEINPVIMKGRIRTKMINHELAKHEYSKEDPFYGCIDFTTREDIIQNECNNEGTLIIWVSLGEGVLGLCFLFVSILGCYQIQKLRRQFILRFCSSSVASNRMNFTASLLVATGTIEELRRIC